MVGRLTRKVRSTARARKKYLSTSAEAVDSRESRLETRPRPRTKNDEHGASLSKDGEQILQADELRAKLARGPNADASHVDLLN